MNLNRIILLIACLIFAASCDEVFEKPVEDKEMIINTPADSTQSSSFTQTFWWEPVEGATNYRIQIVSPSFREIKEITVDSILTSTKFKIALDSGDYEWMVWAFNSTSNNKGKVKPRFLKILGGSLSEQSPLTIIAPKADSITNSATLTFKWQGIPVSNIQYRIQIDSSNLKASDGFVKEALVVGTTFNHTFNLPSSTETSFSWRVRAELISGKDSNQWNGPYSFKIDSKAPAKVVLSSPDNGFLFTKGVDELSWDAVNGANKYELFVYKADSTTRYPGYPLTLTGTIHKFNQGNPNEKLYWEVRAIDAATNVGPLSGKKNFTVK